MEIADPVEISDDQWKIIMDHVGIVHEPDDFVGWLAVAALLKDSLSIKMRLQDEFQKVTPSYQMVDSNGRRVVSVKVVPTITVGHCLSC